MNAARIVFNAGQLIYWRGTLLLIISAALVSSCIGVGDQIISYPPVQISGKMQDSKENPIPGKRVSVAVADVSTQELAMRDALAGELYVQSRLYLAEKTATGQTGEFRVEIPGRQRMNGIALIAGAIPVGHSRNKDVTIVLFEEGDDSPIYRVRLKGRRTQVHRLGATEHDFVKPSQIGSVKEIEAEAKRSKEEDNVKVILTKP